MINRKENFLLGITGSMGSGKSTVTKILEKLGCKRINSDELAKKYTDENSPILKELVEIFGKDVLKDEKIPDKKFIASIVFNDKEKLKKLQDIIHPAIRKEMLDLIASFPIGTIVAWEAPILFEAGADSICDAVLTVYSDYKTSLERTLKRDKISKEEFDARLKNQMDIKEKIELSDFIIENIEKNLEDLEKLSQEILDKILSHRG